MNLGHYICDDGNNVNGDGCAADCMSVEAGWHCSNRGMYSNVNNFLPCQPICGDGIHPNVILANTSIIHGMGFANGDFCDDGLYI
jgi:cysteine-rich repeat protein